MPSVSTKQHRFMEAAAHDPAFAKKAGIGQSVAQDFVHADESPRPLTAPGGLVKRGSYLGKTH